MGTRTIHNRDAIADHFDDLRAEYCPSWSVDRLNANPFEAIRVYTALAVKVNTITPAKARQIYKWLDAGPHMIGDDRSAKNAINDVALAVLATRKQGGLKLKKGRR